MKLNFQNKSYINNPKQENIIELNSTTKPLQPQQAQVFMLDQMLYKSVDGYIDVLPSSVEGELALKKVKPLKRSTLKFTLYVFGCLITGGILYVISVIWPKIYKSMVFNEVKNPFDATHVHIISINDEEFYEKIQFHKASSSNTQVIPFFMNRFMKYIYDESRSSFQALEYELEGKRVGDITQSQPLNQEDIPQLLKYYGHSFIDIVIPGYHQFFAAELLRPINFLLYFGLIIWILELRVTFFGVTLGSTLIILLIICFFVRRTKQQLRDSCLHDEQIEVERSNGKQQISSKNVVPGDIIHINQSLRIPFDCIILEGQLQVNEANITGEAIPVSKIPLSGKSNEEFKFSTQITHLLFEGTSIIQLEDGAARLMVIRAGFSSYKGQIVRSLLHPKPVDKKIYYQGIKFVFAMLFLAYIAYFATLYKLIEIEMLTKDIIYRFFDVIIYCAPPGAPLLINAVIFFSLIRLRANKIFGSDPSKPIQAGRVKTICFDKTGTLTESTVNIQGYQLPFQGGLQQILKEGDKKSILFKLLSSCHQTTVTKNGDLGGDPIDVEMVNFSGWKVGHDHNRKQNYSELNEGNLNKIYTLSINEFHSEYQSMSVITREEQDGNQLNANLYIKGSPEVVLQKCNGTKDERQTLRLQFDSLASQGFRVLGVAYKAIPQQELEEFLKKEREDQELNLTFLGFVIFKNNLKSDTSHVIKQLSETGVKIKIISGDSPITTLRVAQEANIISKENDTILIDWVNRTSSSIQLTRYSQNHNGDFALTTQTIDLTIKDQFHTFIQYCEQSIKNMINICVTGNTHVFFEELIRRHDEKFLSAESDIPKINGNDKNIGSNLRKLYRLLVLSSQLFARTSPSQKANIVKVIKESGEIVCMVGDGTNDSPAIREADVGISFADADGQFSAPYISQNPSLDCVVRIILEGRVSLGISLEIFVSYIQISIIRFIGFQSLSYFYSGFGDFQMSWQAYVSGFVLVYFFLGFSRPLGEIKKCYINDNFFSAQYIISSIFGFICQSVSIIVGLAVLKASSIYIEVPGFDTDKKFMFECQQNTIIFMFSLIHYFYVHLCNNIGAPIKQPWYKNYIVLVLMLAQFIYGCVITLTPKAYIKALKLVPLEDNDLRVSLFFIFNCFGILQVLLEKTIVQKYVLRYHEKQAEKNLQQKYSNLISLLKSDASVIYNS